MNEIRGIVPTYNPNVPRLFEADPPGHWNEPIITNKLLDTQIGR